MYSEKNEELQHKMTEMGESNRVITQVRMDGHIYSIHAFPIHNIDLSSLSASIISGHALEARRAKRNKRKI